jgi:hypothetical protein
MFSVVVVLLTSVSPPSRRAPAKIGRPLLCVPRGIARRRRLLPSDALRQMLQFARDRQTPVAASKEKWRVRGRQIPLPPLREDRFFRRVARSLAPEFALAALAEKTSPTARRSLVRSLSVPSCRIFPRSLAPPDSSLSPRLSDRAHFSFRRDTDFRGLEMHAGRQRKEKVRQLQLAGKAGLKILSCGQTGSLVSP